MPYQPLSRYELRSDGEFSAYSRPRRMHEDGSYEIHLVKATDPLYIPNDFEIWPFYQSAMIQAIERHPAASEDAYAAYLKVREQHQGKANRDR